MGSTSAPTPTAPAHDGTAPAGALTTVFTPPASCAASPALYYRKESCMPMPERWKLYWGAASFCSPGICPSGMVSVATPPPLFGPPVEPGETAIVCCLPAYALYSDSDTHWWCYGSTSVSGYKLIDIATSITSSPRVITTTSISRSYFTTSLLNNPFTVGATPTAGSHSAGASSGGGDGNYGGLSIGAIAGIVVGAVVVGLMVAGFGLPIFILRRGGARKQPQQQQDGFSDPMGRRYLAKNLVAPLPSPGYWHHHHHPIIGYHGQRDSQSMPVEEEARQASRGELSSGEVFHRPVELGTDDD